MAHMQITLPDAYIRSSKESCFITKLWSVGYGYARGCAPSSRGALKCHVLEIDFATRIKRERAIEVFEWRSGAQAGPAAGNTQVAHLNTLRAHEADRRLAGRRVDVRTYTGARQDQIALSFHDNCVGDWI